MRLRVATTPGLADRASSLSGRLRAVGVDVDPATGIRDARPRGEHERDLVLFLPASELPLHGEAPWRPAAVLQRTLEPRDALVPPPGRAATLLTLPAGARIGVSGPRRAAFLAAHRPDAVAVRARGDGAGHAGDVDAVIEDCAEARRAGRLHAGAEVLPPGAWLGGQGQGVVVAVVAPGAEDARRAAQRLDHPPTASALRAERTVARGLDPALAPLLGVLAVSFGRWIRLRALLPSLDGRRLVRAEVTADASDPRDAGRRVAARLCARGAALVA